MQSIERIGVIGLGRIGQQYPAWLRDAGYDVVVYDADQSKVDAVTGPGVDAGDDPADVTWKVNVVLLSLPGNQYVEAVIEGDDGVLQALSTGQVVVDTGTTTPDLEAYYERRCEELAAGYVESPLTYGGPQNPSEEGVPFTMFVGGKREYYDHVREVIECISYTHVYFEDIGKGQVMKSGHRMRQNCQAAVDAEMVEFLRNNGVDPERAASFMQWDLCDRYFEEEYPRVEGFHDTLTAENVDTSDLSDNSYELDESRQRPQLARSHWIKDQEYALDIARSSNTAMPILSTVYQSLLATENYASALSGRDLEFGDADGWEGRKDIIEHYRRLNRPKEEWQRLNNQDGSNRT